MASGCAVYEGARNIARGDITCESNVAFIRCSFVFVVFELQSICCTGAFASGRASANNTS